MSDARPITNITDYVCGSCWNSFSKTDPGVEQGDHLVCPHCGHALPDDAGGDLTAAVRGAPATAHADSDTFEVSGLSGGPAVSAPTTAKNAAIRPHADQGFPELDSANPYGWSPLDMPESPSVQRDSDGSYVVGDADDFGFDEPTLRPDRNHADLMALVRAAPPRPLSDAASPFVAGDEFSIDTDEPTPLEIDGRSTVGVDQDDFGADFGGDAETALVAPQSDPEAEADEVDDYEHRDWKLKAMGLTYNFHGLDALVNWASNKAGQTMAVSSDGGANWKDFHWFFEGMKNGLTAAKAYEAALEPGAPPPVATPGTARTPRMSAVVKGGPPAPELQLGKPGEEKSPQPGVLDAGVAVGSAAPSASAMPAANLGSAGVSSSRQPQQRIGPATSPSRRTPVAARQSAQEARNPVKIAAVIAVIAVVVAALLHLQGVLKIPGLH